MYSRTIIALTAGIALLSWSPSGTAGLSETPAGQLRVTLDRLLSEHAFLTVQAVHAGVTDDDLFAAAAEALEANAAELEAAVAGFYGEPAGRDFGDMWRAHIGYIVDYTRAHEAGDDAARERPQEGLASFQGNLAQFLAGANPELTEETLRSLLEDHLGQLQHVAHLQEGDYTLTDTWAPSVTSWPPESRTSSRSASFRTRPRVLVQQFLCPAGRACVSWRRQVARLSPRS